MTSVPSVFLNQQDFTFLSLQFRYRYALIRVNVRCGVGQAGSEGSGSDNDEDGSKLSTRSAGGSVATERGKRRERKALGAVGEVELTAGQPGAPPHSAAVLPLRDRKAVIVGSDKVQCPSCSLRDERLQLLLSSFHIYNIYPHT